MGVMAKHLEHDAGVVTLYCSGVCCVGLGLGVQGKITLQEALG